MLPAKDSDARVMSITEPAPRPVKVGSAPVLTMIDPRESTNAVSSEPLSLVSQSPHVCGPSVEVPGNENFGSGLESTVVIFEPLQKSLEVGNRRAL